MALGDFISGITSGITTRLKGGTPPPPQVPEGVTSVPANPEVQGDPKTAQTEAASPTLNPTSVEGSTGSNPTVAPNLDDEIKIPVSEPEVSTEQEVAVTTPKPETEEPTTPAEATEGVTPSSPTASEAE